MPRAPFCATVMLSTDPETGWVNVLLGLALGGAVFGALIFSRALGAPAWLGGIMGSILGIALYYGLWLLLDHLARN